MWWKEGVQTFKDILDQDEEFNNATSTIIDTLIILLITTTTIIIVCWTFLFASSGPLSTLPCRTLGNVVRPCKADLHGPLGAF